MEKVQRSLLWAASGIVGLMMFAAQVPFTDAASNLATWLPKRLLDEFPVLQTAMADRIVFVSGIVALLVLGVLLFWPKKVTAGKETALEPKMSNERKSLFDQSTNVGDNNSGTVAPIYNNVVNQAPSPEIEWLSDDNRKIGSSYSFKSLFRVVSPYPVGALKIEVHGTNVRNLEVVPQRTGGQMYGHSGVRDTFAFTTVQNVFGTYIVQFTTDSPNPDLRYDFE